ncbi:MAG TPA: hypothetical protein VIL63_08340, partial [Terriglobales bacterium]
MPNSPIRNSPIRRRSQRGYILLILMLSVALLAIGALALVEKIDFQIKRDREEEMIHRGVQYSRAVRRYFKKFGRYPSRIEELESTNNIRFLRQRYKDPITGKDFKPLHMTDVQMSFGPAVGPGGIGAAASGQGNATGLQGAGLGLSNGQGDAAGSPPVDRGPSAIGGAPPTGDPGLTAGNGQGDSAQNAENAAQQVTAQAAGQGPAQQAGAMPTAAPGPQVFGGGAIVGVVSTSKLKTIREFNKKDHYNQWQFIYDPTSDRGGLLMTPNQPPLKGANPITPSQNGGPGGQNPGAPGDQGN